MPVVDCANCGEETEKSNYKIERNNHLFCSRECYHDFGRPDMQGENNPNPAKEKVEVTCETCGDAFEVYPYRADDARFCSSECDGEFKKQMTGEDAYAWEGAKEEYECENCGETFKNYPYHDTAHCSDECYRETLKERYAGEGNPVWRGGRVRNYGPNWQEQRQKAVERDDHACQDCGKHADEMDRAPDVHHKKRLGWFKEEYDAPEWYRKGNAVDNLVTLCQRCHARREKLGESR